MLSGQTRLLLPVRSEGCTPGGCCCTLFHKPGAPQSSPEPHLEEKEMFQKCVTGVFVTLHVQDIFTFNSKA